MKLASLACAIAVTAFALTGACAEDHESSGGTQTPAAVHDPATQGSPAGGADHSGDHGTSDHVSSTSAHDTSNANADSASPHDQPAPTAADAPSPGREPTN